MEAKPIQTILVVDKDHDFLAWVAKRLEVDGEVRVLKCDDLKKASLVVQKTQVDLILADLAFPPEGGLPLLNKAKEFDKECVVIFYLDSPSSSQIIDATQQGARDVLRKESLPFDLRPVVEQALQFSEQIRSSSQKARPLPKEDTRVKMIGVSRPIQNVFKTIGKVAQSQAPVLIIGESGTGKELVAHAIHEYSPRRAHEMVTVNCGAIPENLLESELFGHERGSFTGAMAKRIGLFEHADQSTLFLDEVGDMPLTVQVKLLRILQEGTFSRVGSNETLKTDVRIIAATNKELSNEVAEGRFREDLYYRLNVIDIHLPPLRARLDDIPILAEHFLRRLVKKQKIAPINLSDQAVKTLQSHHWPGNVRELENTITRACAFCTSGTLLSEDIPFIKGAYNNKTKVRQLISQILLHAPKDGTNVLKWLQNELIESALSSHNSDLALTSHALGLTENELTQLTAAREPQS